MKPTAKYISLAALLAGALLTLPATAQIGNESGNLTWQQAIPRDFPEASWLDTGVVAVGNWEGLAFRTRTGGQSLDGLPVDLKQRYDAEHTEAAVLNLKKAGVTFVLTNFFKTGLLTDHDDMETARKFTELCHKNGLKVGVYIGGTIFAEMLEHDVPEAKNWVAYDDLGQPIHYAWYRYVPDFDNAGYIEYMKQVVHQAITEVHPDMIHFDNLSLSPPPNTADTPEVNRRFRAFLTAKYPERAQRKARFGFADIGGVTVPKWHAISEPTRITAFEDPVMQEWIDFRCQDLADYYRQMATYIHSLDKNIAVELNPHGVFGENGAFLFGIDHPRLVSYGSIYSSEEHNDAGVEGDVLVSKIRSFKQARHLNETAFTYTGPAVANAKLHSWRLLVAESMAYNRNSIGDLGEVLDVASWPDDLQQYIRYFNTQNQHYQTLRNVTDVAVLRSFPATAYNSAGPQLQSTLMEQLLIQYKIPFDIISDRDLTNLSRYRVVVLADQDSLTSKADGQLRDYVAQGGGLIATGETSLYTEWRRRYNDFALADVFHVHVDGSKFSFGSGGVAPRTSLLTAVPDYQESSFGKGRVVYLRAVVPAGRTYATADVLPESEAYRHNLWTLPENSADLLKALRYANGGAPFSVEFTGAPLTTTMELTDNAAGTERSLHWLNYDLRKHIEPAAVTVAIPAGKHVTGVEVLSPDAATQSVPFHEADGRAAFTLPALTVYNDAILHLK
jgi:hypothetical protein